MASLPLGCLFCPSEELLLGYYLANKNNEVRDYNGANLIKELNLYDHYPFEMPDVAGFSYGYRGRERHWYCFTARVAEERRKAKSGFWLKEGEVRSVFRGAGRVVLGTRTRFVFYIGNSLENATRTNWILYEYAMVDNPLATFVLCRIFNCSSENGLSSCVSSDVVEVGACDYSTVGWKNEVPENPLRCVAGQDNHRAVTAPCFVGPQATQQERLFGLPKDGAIFIEAMTLEQRSLSIKNEDFIELDDLV